jgi:hypothetical protein
VNPNLPLPAGIPPIPNLGTLLPPSIYDPLQQFTFATPAAPPCDEQPPNGRLVGQDGKYARVKAAPKR